MKLNKLMIAALALGAMTMVSCEKTQNGGGDIVLPPQDTTATVAQPEVDPVEGAIIIVAQFQAAPCNTVIFEGAYALADGSSYNWSNDGATAAAFTAIDGFDGWYQATIYPNAAADDAGYLARGKAVQLQADGSFNWSGQWDRNSVTLIDGLVELGDENNGEQFLGFAETGVVVYITSTGWQTNPCVEREVFPQVVFNLEIQGDAQEAVYLHGPFVDDAWNGVEMTRVDGNHFTYTVENLAEGTEYQYTLAADNWDVKGIFVEGDTLGSANAKVTAAELHDVIYGFAK